MHDIYENRIRFATHNVLCNPNMYNVGYMADVSMCLAEGGSSAQHRAEIKGINNDGALTIELPTIDLTVGWGNDRGPRMAEYPELIPWYSHAVHRSVHSRTLPRTLQAQRKLPADLAGVLPSRY